MRAALWIVVLAACRQEGGSASTDDPTSGVGPSSGEASSAATSSSASGSGSGSSAGSSSDGSSTGGPPTGACDNADGQLFPPQMAWNTNIAAAATAGDSAAVIAYLQANVQSRARFQIDFGLTVLEADASTPHVPFAPTDEFYSPDCDPAPIPVPRGGHLEGESGYTCDSDGDCHLIVIDRDACRLYEQWRANDAGAASFTGGCLAVWDLDRVYDETLRGDFCTSADAAGLPIAALLFDADEIAAGEIRHAIRFILPNENIRADEFVRPGTHSTSATSGPGDAPPYSARLRLRADVDISGLNEAAQVVARALQNYGMIMSDGGNITFTAETDDFTTAKWDGVGLGPHDLKGLQWSDFEVVDAGPTIAWSSGSCERRPIAK